MISQCLSGDGLKTADHLLCRKSHFIMCPMIHKQFCSRIQTFSPQPALMFYSTNWKPMKKSTAAFCSLQYINGRQRCIGSGHHVWINNVTVPTICLSKPQCKAFPDTGNHGLAGCLMSGHKYQGELLRRDADPGARHDRDIQVLTRHGAYGDNILTPPQLILAQQM